MLILNLANSQKVPTVISYNASGARWGYQINDCEAAIRGIKLLLDESKVVEYGPSIESQSLLDGKRPVEVAGHFLKRLLSYTQGILDRRGLGSLMKTWDVQYIVTVPAVWSDKAKDLTTQAACLAGIPQSNLCLLSEPEAGALYAIRTVQPNSIGVSIDERVKRTTETQANLVIRKTIPLLCAMLVAEQW